MRWPWQAGAATATGAWTAVEAGAFGVHVVRVEAAGGRPRVTLCETLDAGRGIPAALRELRGLINPRSDGCVALLAQGDYRTNVMEPPAVPREELAAALRWALKDLLDYAPEQATVDYRDLAGSGGAASVLVICAPNARVGACQTQFREAQLPLRAIDVPETAQAQLAACFEREGALALLCFHPHGAILTITAQRQLYLVRGSDLSLDRLEGAVNGEREALVERLVVELQRSLDHFERKHGSVAVERLLLPPLHASTGLQEQLADSLYVPVQTMALEEAFDLDGIRQRGPALTRFLPLIGAGLRTTGVTA